MRASSTSESGDIGDGALVVCSALSSMAGSAEGETALESNIGVKPALADDSTAGLEGEFGADVTEFSAGDTTSVMGEGALEPVAALADG
jgi:hypothetical protein